MSQEVKQIRIQSRVDIKAEWSKENPVLLDKEIGYERETGRYKIGDGIHNWNNLLYSSVGNEGVTINEFDTKINNLNSVKADIEYVNNLFNSIVDGEEVYY